MVRTPFEESPAEAWRRSHALPYNARMTISPARLLSILSLSVTVWLSACFPGTSPTAPALGPVASSTATATVSATFTAVSPPGTATPAGFIAADGSRPLIFPADLGAHPDFRTEWWYYTGNLQTAEGRHFGFELTVFRVGLLPPSVALPAESEWAGRDVYFAHFAVSDVAAGDFHAFQRYARSGLDLAGAQASPYRVWLEDWQIVETAPGDYQLQAQQGEIALELTLTDELGFVLHGEEGYSRKGQAPTNASYYFSQPRLAAEGFLEVEQVRYVVQGLAWHDHEFSTGVLDEQQIGWDWFSLQFEDGRALMLFQLRERDGGTSETSSGTFITGPGVSQGLDQLDFTIEVLDQWRSPHTQGLYPSAWRIRIQPSDCLLEVQPWMADQELNLPPITYWEGAVRFTGTCAGLSVRGNGYIELTGYVGELPLP